MGYKILNLLAKVFPFLRALGHEDWQDAYDEEDDEEGLLRRATRKGPFEEPGNFFRHDPNKVLSYVHTAIHPQTPEELFRMDRITNWHRGQYGDVELFPNFEELLIRRAFNEQLERRIIGG